MQEIKGHEGSIPMLGRSPGGGNGYPLQSSCLEKFHGQRNLMDYSPWGPKEWGMTERSHTHTIYRAFSYYFTINTIYKNPIQWVIILQPREVEGFTTTREKPRLQPPHLVAFFASISAEGPTGGARRWLIPSFPSPPTILLSPAEACTEVRLASCWVMRRFTGLVKEAKKSDECVSDLG